MRSDQKDLKTLNALICRQKTNRKTKNHDIKFQFTA